MSDLASYVRGYYDTSYPPGILNAPGGGDPPVLVSLNPTSIVAGDPPVLLTVTGTDFIAASKIWADEEQQLTTFVSATSLTYMAQADQAGTQTITVRGGGETSNALELDVTATAAETRDEPTEPTDPTDPPTPPPPPPSPPRRRR